SPDIKECFFLDNDAPVSTLDDLSIAVATDGRACEISGMLTGDGVQPGITVQALSTTGEDTATVIFTITPKPLGLVRRVSTGHRQSCVVNIDGELYCWGTGAEGQLGLGNQANRSRPGQAGNSTNWSQVSPSDTHTCAVNTNGALYCWGLGSFGKLGLGNNTNLRASPIQVGSLTNWSQVSTGVAHTCAVNTNGELYCWGAGLSGRLGLGNTNSPNTPTQVGSLTNWSQVSAAFNHTCAVNTAGELYCWGPGINGRLGLPDTNGRDAPTKVGSSTNWSQVSGGNLHTCALNTVGEIYCWGEGSSGRLGLTDTDGRTTPTQVGTLTNWTQVSAGEFHTCAVNTNGELHCWGAGSGGQLGLGSNTSTRTTPTQVGTSNNWSQVSASITHTCAVNTSAELYCWGTGGAGRLGLGHTNDRTTPQLVSNSQLVSKSRTLTVAPVLANITLTGPAGVVAAGNIIPPLTFANTGGDVQPDGCAIDTASSRPALPAGLRAHPIVSGSNVTCQISGIPTAAADMATYYLTATNAIGTSAAVTVSFQVDIVRPLLAGIAAEQSYTVGTAITAQTFTNTGHGVATDGCTASP
ncbi:MAG: hypothetical protein K8963_10620, partial [Proteobacteria bacterium]|nr:hypothetical protein [Pseudomonadota bacterium]